MKQQLGLLLNRHQRNIKKLKKISSSIDINEINIDKIIQILQKTSERSLSEISALKYYILNKTNLVYKFTEDKLDEASYDLIISLSLSSSSLKTFKRDNLIINIGEPSDNLYIILKGKAALFGIKKYHLDVSPYEYFLLLNELKKNNDVYLLEKTVTENNRIYPIDYEDVSILSKILLKIYLSKKSKRTSVKYLESLLEKVGLNYSDFNLDSYIKVVEKRNKDVIEAQKEIDWTILTEEEKIEEYKKLMIYDLNEAWNYTLKNEKTIFDSLSFIDIDLMKKYNYLTKVKDEEMVVYYKCEFIDEINENEYFGNSEHQIYINKVISLSNNLNIMCIKGDLYNEYVRKLNSKVIGSQINFLLDNFYFHPLYKGFFEKYYFKFFELVEYKVKQIIVKENDPVRYLYFIKSGSVKLTSTRSIAENHILIELIKNILLKSEKSENNNIKLDLDNLYSNVTNNLEYFSNDMNIKNPVHIMTLQHNNSIGSECLYYGFNFLYTAEVNSEVVEIYQIPLDKIMRILNDKTSKVFYYYGKYSAQSLKLLFNRLTKLNNMLLGSLNKSKIRQYGDIFNLNVLKFGESIYKNDIKFTNKMDKFSLETLQQKEKSNSRKQLNKQNTEKDPDKMNLDINNIDSKLFITQKSRTPQYTKIDKTFFSQSKKTRESYKNNKDDITKKIIETLKRNNSLNLFPVPKDSTKDMTSHIKFFDYRENLEKQKEREEIRATKALILLEKQEQLEMEKLKFQTKTYTDWFKLSIGDKRNLILQNEPKDVEEKKDYNSFSSNSNIYNLYNRDVFKKSKMLMTSLYKNKFSDYFDKKLGSKYFKYDMSRTLLSNKKKFEYSIFDKRFTKNFSSLPKKRDRYNNLLNFKKNNKINNRHKKLAEKINKLNRFESIKIIPIRQRKEL